MLARVGVVGAGTAGSHLARARKQVQASRGDVPGDLRRQVTVQHRGSTAELSGDRVQHLVPLVVGEPPDPDPDVIRAHPAPLNLGPRLPRGEDKLTDRPFPGVVPATGQPVGIQPGPLLQRVHPGPAPPGVTLPRRCAARGGHDATRSDTSPASSSSDSSAIQPSPEPTTASASSRLVSRRDAMRSSSVPSVISRCTWTGRS